MPRPPPHFTRVLFIRVDQALHDTLARIADKETKRTGARVSMATVARWYLEAALGEVEAQS